MTQHNDMHPPLDNASLSRLVEGSFRRNTVLFMVIELGWCFGVACFMPYTIIPAYLSSLGASKTLIQSVVALMTALGFCMVLSSRFMHGPRRRIQNIMCWVVFNGSFVIYGLLAYFLFSKDFQIIWIAGFVLIVVVTHAAGAIGAPVFEEIVVQAVPEKKRGTIAAIRSFVAGLSGISGALFAAWFFARWSGVNSYHARFAIGPVVILVACCLMVFLRDHTAEHGRATRSESIFKDARELFANMNFRALLVFQGMLAASVSLAPLMVTFGSDHMDNVSADYFTTASFLGIMIFGMLVSLLADKFGFRLIGILNACMLCCAFICPIVAGTNQWVLLGGYMLFGGSTILTMFTLPNLGYEMVPHMRPATIVAVGSAVTMPVALIIAPLSGVLVDALGFAGYQGAFAAGAGFSLCAMAGFIFIIREPRTGQELYTGIRHL